MTVQSDKSLAALLLTQRLVDVAAAPLKASEYWSLLEKVPDPGALLGLDPSAVAALAGVDQPSAERIATLLEAATAFAFALDEARQAGFWAVASVDEGYPPSLAGGLGRSAPPAIYGAGDAGLLSARLLGIVGSRQVDEAAADVARGAARQAAANGFGMVSGGAKGVDRLAMQAALEDGAPVVCVLADSLLRTARDADVRRAITDGRLCLCTPYRPSAGFSVANAMGRNKLIYALSAATLVVAAEEGSGGTWSGAVEALRQGTAPVLVWMGDGAGPATAALVERGGTAIGRLDEIFPLPEPRHATRADARQLALEL